MGLKWLEWAQQLQAIAQNGVIYCQNPYDLEQYAQMRQIAVAQEQIPELSLTRVVPSQIARLFARYYHPDWQTDFG